MPELPLLDETRCTGCGDCVAVCPAGCLEAFGALVWLQRPLDCISCGVCYFVCPAGAIRMSEPPGAETETPEAPSGSLEP